MGWAGRVACMGGEERCILGFGGETRGTETTLKAQAICEDNIKIGLQELGLGEGGRGRHGLDFSGSGWGEVEGSCECRNEPSGSVKCVEFLVQLSTCYLLKTDSAPWS